MAGKILLTLPYPKEYLTTYDECIELSNNAGYEIVLAPGDLDEKSLQRWVPGICGAVCSGDSWTRSIMDKAPELKVLSRMGVGYDRIDLQAAKEKGIVVTITRGANSADVAEYTLALILSASRSLLIADRSVRSGEWPKLFGHSLFGKTIGIIGLGNIGKRLAQLVTAFGMKVIAYDCKNDPAFANDTGIIYLDFEQVIASSDVISIHLPLSTTTRKLFGRKEFSIMKKNVIIVNCARGGIIDEDALLDAIDRNIVFAAALDVFEHEPLPLDSRLRNYPQVILSPHVAGLTFEGRGLLVKRAFRNALDVLAGLMPDDTITEQLTE